MKDKSENIVKKVCKELGITQKELAERIGYSESAIKMAVSNNKLSDPMRKAIELYYEKINLERKLEKELQIKKIFKEWLSE